MQDKCVLGVDCGTQSLRAALYRSDGALLAQSSHSYATSRPEINRAEQDPEDWWNALCHAVPECVEAAGVPREDIAAIACDGTSFTGVFCSEEGIPLRSAILWMDLRASQEAKQVEATQHPILDYCGRRISPEWLLPKTLWVQKHEPAVYNKSARIVEGVDWLIHRLTGQWVTSTGNAAGKRHWTPGAGWPLALYEELGLGDLHFKSPDRVLYAGEPVSEMLSAAAEALGLSTSCVVSHAGMDGWTAPIGKNCFARGRLSLTLGTSTVVIAETATPAIIEGVMGPFPDGIRKGMSVYEAGQTSGGSTVGWMLALLHAQDGDVYRALEDAARRIPPGSEGLVVFDAWRGNRTPYFDPGARGTICGLTLEHTPAHLYRAVLEGCSFGIRNVIDTFRRAGTPVNEIRACGTGAGNALWTEIIASVLEMPLLVSEEKHATCLGSAVCAAVACGAHGSIEQAAAAMQPRFTCVEPSATQQTYRERFGIYLETYAQMKHTMWRLAGSHDPRQDRGAPELPERKE